MSLSPGTPLGPYRIVSPLGAGGMGEVYRARDERLGRDVAIKVLPVEVASDPDRVARFEREAQVLAALSHPNILAIHDFGKEKVSLRGAEGPDAIPSQEITYAVTELLEGETLRERLRQERLPWRKAVEIAAAIADGLAAAHGKGIIHRDLKPDNVFATSDGRVKILDFGLARLTASPLVEAQTFTSPPPGTLAGAVLGTVGYMAPEQVRGEPADARSDIFALGCVLYEVLTGERAFERDTAAETMAAILREPAPEVSTSGVVATPELNRIVAHCLEKQPAERFQSASDVAFALRSLATGGTTTMPVPTRRFNKKTLIAAAAAVFLVAVSTALLLLKPWRAAPPAAALDPRKVVVAPFENRTRDPGLESFGSLIAEAVTRDAALAGGAAVVPGTSFAAKGAERASVAALHALAKESGAGLVVSGAYYLVGDELRIQAQLFDASQGSVLVTFEPITGSRGTPSSLLEPLRQRVLGAIACFGDDAMLDPRLIHIPTLDAWVEFRRGWELVAVDYPKVLAHFARASELDPDFVPPRVFAVTVFYNLGQCENMARVLADLEGRLERFTSFERLFVAWDRAMYEHRAAMALHLVKEIQQSIARGTGGRVSYLYQYTRAFTELELNLPRQAVSTTAGIPASWMPLMVGMHWWARANLAWAYHSLEEYETELKVANEGLHEYPDVLDFYGAKGRALAALGRLADVDRVVDEALGVAARSGGAGGVMNTAAVELRIHGHREASLRMAERAVAWYRARPAAEAASYLGGLTAALIIAERWAEAKAIADALLANSPDDIVLLRTVASLAARLGDPAQARQVAVKLRDRKSDCLDGYATYHRACIAAHLGEKREAMALLREAVAQGFGDWSWMHVDMGLEPLRGDPEFKEFVRPKG